MSRTTPLRIALIAAAALLAGCNTAPPLAYSVPHQPEGASGSTRGACGPQAQFDYRSFRARSSPSWTASRTGRRAAAWRGGS